MSALVGLVQPDAVERAAAAGCVGPDGAVRYLCSGIKSIHIPVEYRTILPVLILVIGASAILVLSSVLPKRSRPGLWVTLSTLVGGAALIVSAFLWTDIDHHGARLAIGGQVAFDHFSVFAMIIISAAVVLSSLVADGYLQREGLDGPEAYVLMLLSASGGMIMAESAGLLMMFLGLEILSIAMYVLAAYHRRRIESGEAGMKYFVLGSVSSAIFLYGVALVYGATGSTQFNEIAVFLARNHITSNGVLLAGMGMLIVGLGFKVAAVPFHSWSPDVYQGSPNGVTGFLASVGKVGAFAGLLRILVSGLNIERLDWRPVIWILAVLSLLVGGVLAVVQRDVKRMLAYSSVNHAGYILIGLQAASARGVSGSMYYLLAYTFMIIGSFAVVGVIQGKGEADNDISSFRGLAQRRPWLAVCMTVFLLAQAGVPLTTGFLSKFYVITASVQRGQYSLAIIGMIVAALTAFFYLRIALYMFTPVTTAEPTDDSVAVGDVIGDSDGLEPAGAAGVARTSGALGEAGATSVSRAGGAVALAADEAKVGTATVYEAGAQFSGRLGAPVATVSAIAVCALFTVVFGFFPEPVIDFARRATLIF